jgi:hypothetical protein
MADSAQTDWSSYSLSDLLGDIRNLFGKIWKSDEQSQPEHADTEAQRSPEETFFDDKKEFLDRIEERVRMLQNRQRGLQDEVGKIDKNIGAIARTLRERKSGRTADRERLQVRALVQRKKLLLQEADQMGKLGINLEAQLIKLESAAIHRNTGDTMKEMNSIMKELVKGMKVRTIERTMEQSEEIGACAEEIASVLGQPLSVNYVEDDEIDDVLNSFASWDEDCAVEDAAWPEPVRSESPPVRQQRGHADDLADRELGDAESALFA